MTVGTASKAAAGRVVVGRVTAAGTWQESRELWQGTADDDVSGTAEAGDRMGESLTAVNTDPRAVSTAATMRLAVGVPGEALGTTVNAGAVHTFSLVAAAGANDRWIEAGDGDGIPVLPAPTSTWAATSTTPAPTCTWACRTAPASALCTPCPCRTPSSAAPSPR